jgi:hypothetical protein
MLLELFQAIISIQTPFNMIVLVVLFGSVAGVLTGIATQIRKYGCHRQDIDFKRELLDRGMSADEIARVVESSQPKDFLDRWAASCGRKKTG